MRSKPYKLALLFENHLGHVAHVELIGYSIDQQGHEVLTPEARSMREFEEYVNWLRKDLDRIVVEARRKFALPQPPLYPTRKDLVRGKPGSSE